MNVEFFFYNFYLFFSRLSHTSFLHPFAFRELQIKKKERENFSSNRLSSCESFSCKYFQFTKKKKNENKKEIHDMCSTYMPVCANVYCILKFVSPFFFSVSFVDCIDCNFAIFNSNDIEKFRSLSIHIIDVSFFSPIFILYTIYCNINQLHLIFICWCKMLFVIEVKSMPLSFLFSTVIPKKKKKT